VISHDSSRNVRVVSGLDDTDAHIFSVLVKESYNFFPDGTTERTDPAAWVELDAHYGDPARTSVRRERDLAPFRVATDVVAIADAHPPNGEQTARFSIGLRVGGVSRVLQVTGDRYCAFRDGETPLVSDPAPVKIMPVIYERAYGGVDGSSVPDMEFAYPRNPVGRGFAIANKKETIENLILPNIEDPEELLSRETIVTGRLEDWHRQPLPAGLGWFGRGWYPRMVHAGVMPAFIACDQHPREEALGLVPRDHVAMAWQFRLPAYDPRAASGASAGFALPYPRGGEQIVLGRLTPHTQAPFHFPRDRPTIRCDIGFGERLLDVVPHMLAISARSGRFDVVWRGAHRFPGLEWLPSMRVLTVIVT
jgi:hypothetical protein